ncbi:hypothetical protein MKW92_036841, partial [Papaver armeniacum]
FCLCKIYKQPSKSPGNSYLPTDGDAEEMPFVDPFPWFKNNPSVAEENERWEMELKEENQTNAYFNELPDMDQNDSDFWDFDGQHLLTDQQHSLIRCDRINSPVAAQHQQQPQQQWRPQQQTQQQWRPQQQTQQQWRPQQQTQQHWHPQQQTQQQWHQQQQTQQHWHPQQQTQQQWHQQQQTQQQWHQQQQPQHKKQLK